MKKTVMASFVALLFISSLLLVDGMVAIKNGGKKFMVFTGRFFNKSVLVQYTSPHLYI